MDKNHCIEKLFAKQYPMCQLFRISADYNVVYDAKPNFAFVLSDKELELLARFLDLKKNEGAEWTEDEISTINHFKKLKECGVFIEGPAESVSETNKEKLSEKINYYDKYILQRKFVLEATEDCNFRCKYCPNTINLGSNVRQHAKRYMSLETAKAAIDYYFEQYVKIFKQLSKEKQILMIETLPPTLSWYGGEPLLNFEVMEQATEYFKQKPWNTVGIETKDLFFSTNSNMSIMNDRILDYLVSNNVQLFASLDGPKEENDKCRVFSDGRGTFDTVVKNLRKIRKRDENYFKERVSILSVIADDYDRDACQKYFNEGEFSDLDISSSRQEYVNCSYKAPNSELKRLEDNFEDDYREIRNDIDKANIDDSSINNIEYLLPYVRVQTDNPHGTNNLGIMLTCPMGIDNNMIGVDGDIHVCHKTDGSAPFANIHCLPIDYEKLVNIFMEHNKAVNNGECRSCWSARYCAVCGAKRLQKGKMVNPNHAECDVIRMEQKLNMMAFFYAMKNRPDIIEYFEKRKENRREYISILDIHSF